MSFSSTRLETFLSCYKLPINNHYQVQMIIENNTQDLKEMSIESAIKFSFMYIQTSQKSTLPSNTNKIRSSMTIMKISYFNS